MTAGSEIVIPLNQGFVVCEFWSGGCNGPHFTVSTKHPFDKLEERLRVVMRHDDRFCLKCSEYGEFWVLADDCTIMLTNWFGTIFREVQDA